MTCAIGTGVVASWHANFIDSDKTLLNPEQATLNLEYVVGAEQ